MMSFSNFKVISLAACLVILSACQQLAVEKRVDKAGVMTPKTEQANAAILRYDTIHHPVVSNAGMVVSQNQIASQVGADILQRGGNAIDAAVAVGFALAVTLPRAGNIGGSGFLVAKMREQEPIALDFRSSAPELAQISRYQDDAGEIDSDLMKFGPKAPGVPGTVAGLYQAWQMAGSLPWRDLLLPAIKLARDGIKVTPDLHFALTQADKVLSRYPASVEHFYINGELPKVGDNARYQDLAWSLEQIAEDGAQAFYSGEIAQRIDRYMQDNGGLIRHSDLANYKVKVREPLTMDFYGYKVVTMPPSSSGGITLLQILRSLEMLDINQYQQGSAQAIHLIAEVMKRTAANRRSGIGDPDFVDVPIADMNSDALAQELIKDISPNQVTEVANIKALYPHESPDTTHYSVADSMGNVVSLTYTLGYSYGSGVVVPGTGILLDNQIKNFYHRIPNHANQMQTGKRMISTMTPTLVLQSNGAPFVVTGSPGGGRIPNVVAQLLLNTLVYDQNIAQATHSARIHQQWRTPELGVEQGFSVDTRRRLESFGHKVEQQQTMGSTQSIMLKNGLFYGSADPRRPGAAAVGVNQF